MSDETGNGGEGDAQISFKVKTSSDGMHSITIAETASVLDLKNKLAGKEYEDVAADRQRLIYSGRVMKNEEPLSTYKIKAGNTIHMVKSAASNAAQNPSNAASSGAAPSGSAGVPTNMAAGTANNPLAGLTGARYAGHASLPSLDMFGADGGMRAPPTEDQMADMLDNPATAQMMNEALNNPQMIEMMIQSNPTLRNMGPAAREMLQSPMFRQMMTNPAMMRQAAAMQRQMQGGAGASSFPAPGITDNTPAGPPGTNAGSNPPPNPFAALGGGNPFGALGGAGNPFAQMFPPGGFGNAGNTPLQSPPLPGSAGQATPSAGDANSPPNANANPFASMFGGPDGNPFGNMPPPTPEQLQQAMQMLGGGGFGGANPFAAFGDAPSAAAAAPADSRPPEELYADQLRQLNDMGFFDFDQNVQALRRSGGSVTGAVNQLLGG